MGETFRLPLPTAKAGGFLGCSLLKRHAGPVLHQHWWCSCRHRSTGVHFRRLYGRRPVYHKNKDSGLRTRCYPPPFRAGSYARFDKPICQAARIG
jgi:hypothetical protein